MGTTMKRSLSIGALVGLLVSVGVVGTADATPDESQRLRGVGGRSFEVMVTVTEVDAGVLGGFGFTVGEEFPNCYTFEADEAQTWRDPRFPGLGTWEQLSTGAATAYTVTASGTVFGFELELAQEGSIRPVPAGTLALAAEATVTSMVGDRVTAESVGREVDSCPVG